MRDEFFLVGVPLPPSPGGRIGSLRSSDLSRQVGWPSSSSIYYPMVTNVLLAVSYRSQSDQKPKS